MPFGNAVCEFRGPAPNGTHAECAILAAEAFGAFGCGVIRQPTETLGAFRYGNECDWPCVTG